MGKYPEFLFKSSLIQSITITVIHVDVELQSAGARRTSPEIHVWSYVGFVFKRWKFWQEVCFRCQVSRAQECRQRIYSSPRVHIWAIVLCWRHPASTVPQLLYSHPYKQRSFFRLIGISFFRKETIWNNGVIHMNSCGTIAAALVRAICQQVQERFLSPGSLAHPLMYPPVVPIPPGGIMMSWARLVTSPMPLFMFCGCAHDSQCHCWGQTT